MNIQLEATMLHSSVTLRFLTLEKNVPSLRPILSNTVIRFEGYYCYASYIAIVNASLPNEQVTTFRWGLIVNKCWPMEHSADRRTSSVTTHLWGSNWLALLSNRRQL